jgi:hypothetical protein
MSDGILMSDSLLLSDGLLTNNGLILGVQTLLSGDPGNGMP